MRMHRRFSACVSASINNVNNFYIINIDNLTNKYNNNHNVTSKLD